MSRTDSRRQLRRATIIFWVLLSYIVIALAWWFLSLERQNQDLRDLKREQLAAVAPGDTAMRAAIEERYGRNSLKYVYEGLTFLLLLIFGAAYIYRLVRRQFRLQQQQQNFVMAITHELKTPLSVARLNLETLQKRQLPEDRQQRLLAATLTETVRLDTLINNVLLSSQLDAAAYQPTREELDLSELVAGVLQKFSARYPSRRLAADITPGIAFDGDPLLLQLLVSNLVENANKYSPRDKAIACVLAPGANGPVLTVRDEGPGIPDKEKKNVFRKFYRVGNEQTRSTQGTGLGLYISELIVRAHGGEIDLSDNVPTGATFTVRF
ncbi:two-component sensor histidine kinase [Flaviaesturariibacter flavus]|uniref:histidine kinase n=1 Tax=Flaviaesturariibacter flavus TaxID=2502780 RepID=A0A4R1BAH9_9BACT|nr:ATP-binding protein [Flaviaesturariibacter flavus]TCJ13959.1 two-component sensor histidine kinase [Flaviaesturariibacter flavus]